MFTKLLSILTIAIHIKLIISNEKYQEALEHLYWLEEYANEYIKMDPRYSVDYLIANYIRSGKYNDKDWEKYIGEVPQNFTGFVDLADMQSGQTTSEIKKFEKNDTILEDAQNTTIDIVHLFASIAALQTKTKSTDPKYLNEFKEFLASQNWVIDLFNMIKTDLIDLTGKTYSEVFSKAKSIIATSDSQFDMSEIVADMDAPFLLELKKNNSKFYWRAVFRKYVEKLDNKTRTTWFIKQYFPNLYDKSKTQKEYMNAVYNEYDKNDFIAILEVNEGIRRNDTTKIVLKEYENIRQAAADAFGEYLYQNRPYFPSSGAKYINFFGLLFLIFIIIL